METGKVIFFNERKAFGFIKRIGEPDTFVHISQVADEKFLEKGENVTFEIEQTEKGPQARNVEVVTQ